MNGKTKESINNERLLRLVMEMGPQMGKADSYARRMLMDCYVKIFEMIREMDPLHAQRIHMIQVALEMPTHFAEVDEAATGNKYEGWAKQVNTEFLRGIRLLEKYVEAEGTSMFVEIKRFFPGIVEDIKKKCDIQDHVKQELKTVLMKMDFELKMI